MGSWYGWLALDDMSLTRGLTEWIILPRFLLELDTRLLSAIFLVIVLDDAILIKLG